MPSPPPSETVGKRFRNRNTGPRRGAGRGERGRGNGRKKETEVTETLCLLFPLLGPTCLPSAVHRQTEAVSRGISCPSDQNLSSPLLSPRAMEHHTQEPSASPSPVIFSLLSLPIFFPFFPPESLSFPPFFSHSLFPKSSPLS